MLKVIPPPAHLAKYVVCFWFGRFDNATSAAYTHLAHATTMPQLLFHLDGIFQEVETKQRVFHAGVYGHSATHKRYVTTSSSPCIFGVQFFSGALPALFSVPAMEITGQAIDLRTLAGHEGVMLMEKIFEARSETDIVSEAIRFLELRERRGQIRSDAALQALIKTIHQVRGDISISQMIDQSCMSERHFERRFKEHTGFTAKKYSKIVRFESLIDKFMIAPGKLTEIALEFGYYDQAHCNHDFKTFTGISPSEYARRYGTWAQGDYASRI